jgi:SWI/SNF chromatin-remodeling complex subunit SWI1
MAPTSPQNQGFDQHATLDPSSIAKQMAALNAAGMARMANGRPLPGAGATPYLNQHSGQESGNQNLQQVANTNMQANTQPSADTSIMAQAYPAARASQQNAQSVKQRQRNFLSGLANMMSNRDMPLPQALTGIPSNYDPTNSPWKVIEPTPGEVGSFRLAGRDVDLFKLWGIVFHLGGGQKVC